MFGETAAYTGAENIINAFDVVSDGNPYYSLWKNKELITQNTINDFDKAKERLVQWLTALEQSGSTDIYKVRFHPAIKEKGDRGVVITDKSPYIGTMTFRVCRVGGDASAAIAGTEKPGDMPNAVWYMLKGIKDGLEKQDAANTALLERVNALETGGAITGIDEEVDVWDKIGGLLGKPVVQQAISQLMPQIVPLITGVLKPQNNIMVNGIDNTANIEDKSDVGSENGQGEVSQLFNTLTETQNDMIDNAIFRLSHHTNDIAGSLAKLADYADANPDTFKLLLSNLK